MYFNKDCYSKLVYVFDDLDTRLNSFGFGRKIPPTMHIRRPIEKIMDILLVVLRWGYIDIISIWWTTQK